MSGPAPRWVPRLVIEAVHLDQIREHGGLIRIRNENALESALTRARQRWNYEDDVDLARLAADDAFRIATNHPFRDGNKRTAVLAAAIFLGLNGLDFLAPEDEVVAKMSALASGELDETALTDWIPSRVESRPERS